MKALHYNYLIGSLILAAALICASLILKERHSHSPELLETSKPLLTISEAAAYLGLTEQQVKYIIVSEKNALQQSKTFTGMMFPYFEIDNEIFISKEGLKAWITEVTLQRKQYSYH